MFGCGTYTSTVGDVIRESGKWLAINEDDHAAQFRKNRHLRYNAQLLIIGYTISYLCNSFIYRSLVITARNCQNTRAGIDRVDCINVVVYDVKQPMATLPVLGGSLVFCTCCRNIWKDYGLWEVFFVFP